MGQSSKDIYLTNPQIDLAKKNRTFVKNEKDKTFMYYTNDKEKGFVSFDQCYDHWVNETKNDEAKSVEDVFKVDIGELKSHLPEKLGIKGDHHIREDAIFILKHFDEMEMYEALEDEYKCSGMCESALFYFSRHLHEGPPQ